MATKRTLDDAIRGILTLTASVILAGGVCLAQQKYSVAAPKRVRGIIPKSASMMNPAGQPIATNHRHCQGLLKS
jgi:hypothetical protein